MIIVLSPAKSLDYETPPHIKKHTLPEFVDDAAELIGGLRALSSQQIGSMMGISDQLVTLNFQRYAEWSKTFDAHNSKQAVLAFNGDVYEGLAAKTLSSADLDFAQNHVRVQSGLYGLLRLLDLLQQYRLEMGTRFPNARGKDLYAFWGKRITVALNAQMKKQRGARAGELRGKGILQVREAQAAHGAGDLAGVRGLEGRVLQDHQLSCETRAA